MKYLSLFLLRFYKAILSPFFQLIFGNACRFNPTCSEYAYKAIKKYGFLYGSFLSMKRVLKCNGFSKESGFDPVC
ncbi:MAG: membrane protein insertion efficiency factor YidD [Patescibacteria group bacterium]|nr:membrane protein insertion efficiency factor YidD [Patescibacteria group bacterium]